MEEALNAGMLLFTACLTPYDTGPSPLAITLERRTQEREKGSVRNGI